MLHYETRYYWSTCQAVRVSSNGDDPQAARDDVEDLEMVGLYASTFRLLAGAAAGLEAATRARNPIAREAAASALRTLRWAVSPPWRA